MKVSVTNIESLQYNATLLITETIWGSSREKKSKELVLETLYSKRWLRRFCCYKIKNNGIPSHLVVPIPPRSHLYNTSNTRNTINILLHDWFI